jgi:hypothetical protein
MNNSSRTRMLMVALVIGVILTLMLSTLDAWAAPAQSPLRQSVPTKTPLSGEEGQGTKAPRPSPTAISIPTPELSIIPEKTGMSTPMLIVIGVVVVAVVGAAVVLLTRMGQEEERGSDSE